MTFTPNGADMRVLQPCDAPLRRHFLPGVKVEYSVSPRQRAYRVQIHRIQVRRPPHNRISWVCSSSFTIPHCLYTHPPQIQNQLPGAIFPYVFYPVKLPKSITMDSGVFASGAAFHWDVCSPCVSAGNIILLLLLLTEPKPLTDISIVTRAAGHSDISRIK